jgi:hypothetical protein
MTEMILRTVTMMTKKTIQTVERMRGMNRMTRMMMVVGSFEWTWKDLT